MEFQRTEEQSNRYKCTPEWSNVLCGRGILLSDSINPKRRLWQQVKDVGVEYDLMNDLGFNLCVAPQSPVMRWSCILEWREVIKGEVLREVN